MGRTYRQFYETFQKRLEQGDQRDCFATKFFSMADDFGFDKDQQMFVAGTLIEAGTPPPPSQHTVFPPSTPLAS